MVYYFYGLPAVDAEPIQSADVSDVKDLPSHGVIIRCEDDETLTESQVRELVPSAVRIAIKDNGNGVYAVATLKTFTVKRKLVREVLHAQLAQL